MAYNEKTIVFGPTYHHSQAAGPEVAFHGGPGSCQSRHRRRLHRRRRIENWDAYAIELNKRLGLDNQLIRMLGSKARRDPKRLVFAEADNIKILKVAQILYDEGVAYPMLLGDEKRIRKIASANNIDIDELPIIDPRSDEQEERRRAL